MASVSDTLRYDPAVAANECDDHARRSTSSKGEDPPMRPRQALGLDRYQEFDNQSTLSATLSNTSHKPSTFFLEGFSEPQSKPSMSPPLRAPGGVISLLRPISQALFSTLLESASTPRVSIYSIALECT